MAVASLPLMPPPHPSCCSTHPPHPHFPTYLPTHPLTHPSPGQDPPADVVMEDAPQAHAPAGTPPAAAPAEGEPPAAHAEGEPAEEEYDDEEEDYDEEGEGGEDKAEQGGAAGPSQKVGAGASWVEGLKLGGYDSLSVHERLSALLLLCHSLMDAPTLRTQLELRVEECQQAKKALFEEVKVRGGRGGGGGFVTS